MSSEFWDRGGGHGGDRGSVVERGPNRIIGGVGKRDEMETGEVGEECGS